MIDQLLALLREYDPPTQPGAVFLHVVIFGGGAGNISAYTQRPESSIYVFDSLDSLNLDDARRAIEEWKTEHHV